MLRGLSNQATRSRRNFKMRLLCCGSSFASWRSTSAESSTFQAMPLQSVLEWNGVFLAATDAIQCTLGQIEVLKIIEMLEDGLAAFKGLGATGTSSEFFQALFDGLWEANGQHK